MKKILAMALALSLLLFIVPAQAATTGEHGAVVSVDTYTEVTDVDALANYALALYGTEDGISTFAAPLGPSNITAVRTTEGFQLDQLLESRIYADGTIEEKHASTSFLFIDVQGKEMTIPEVKAVKRAAAVTRGSSSGTGSGYGVAIGVTLNYSSKYVGNEFAGAYQRQFNSVTTTIGANTSLGVVNFTQYGKIYHDLNIYTACSATVNNATTYGTYRAASTNTGWYELKTSPFGDHFEAGATVTVSGMGTFTVIGTYYNSPGA